MVSSTSEKTSLSLNSAVRYQAPPPRPLKILASQIDTKSLCPPTSVCAPPRLPLLDPPHVMFITHPGSETPPQLNLWRHSNQRQSLSSNTSSPSSLEGVVERLVAAPSVEGQKDGHLVKDTPVLEVYCLRLRNRIYASALSSMVKGLLI